MLIRTHVGVSLDGFVATPDGLPAWDAMPTFGPGSHGNDEFSAQCAAVVIGRTSFDQGFEVSHWLPNWPYPGKQVYVLTSRPLPREGDRDGHRRLAGRSGGARRAAARRGPGARRPRARRSRAPSRPSWRSVRIDRLGMVVLPVLLGKGIPLFPLEIATFSRETWEASLAAPNEAAARPPLRLEDQRVFPDGAVELVYRPESLKA